MQEGLGKTTPVNLHVAQERNMSRRGVFRPAVARPLWFVQ